MTKKLTTKDATTELWNRGELKYKLKGKQKELYDDFREGKNKINVICSSRRMGKSTVLCTLAIEECIRNKCTIKYAAPTKQQVEEILNSVMPPLLEDVPPHLKPEWMEAKKKFVFPNGSQIQIAATENNQIDRLRGGQATLAIVDEAGFATNLNYVIQNILIPAIATTKGKIILCSTPNYEDPNHIFNTEYVKPLEASGKLKKFTIYDAPMLDAEDIASTIEAYGGEDNPRFQCEFLCNIAIDPDSMVIGEFTPEKELDIVKEIPKPVFYDVYTSMDIGFRDLTGVLFAWYDYLNARIVIEDEFVVRGAELTTDFLASNIKQKEASNFRDPKSGLSREPFLRISDNNNLILVNDLYRLHNIGFIPTKKDNKDAQINEVKMLIKNNQIIINPKCKNLLYHLRSAKWNKSRKDFIRLRDMKEDGLVGGHADLLDALIYLARNVIKSKNPYPDGFFIESGPNIFNSNIKPKNKEVSGFMKGVMGIKSKK